SLTSLSRDTVYLSEEILDVQLHDQLALVGDVVGIPVYRSGPIHCVLVASVERISHSAVEMVEVLATQAATVLDHVRMFDEAEGLRQRLSHRAFHDELTGLPNRAEFTRQLERRLSRGDSDEDGVAVLFLDLDGFKEVNDAHGHASGDILLGAVAGRLRNCVRPDDHVARLGGDEFTVLLTRTDSSDSSRAVARRIQEVISQPYNVNGQDCRVGSSIGVAYSDDASIDPLTLLKRADAAMYQAKRGGKAQVRVDDGSHLQLELETWLP
ncbi:MAG: diguanylate cyclase domain-containing protein, partial [Acidimicrobiales bacterium]